MNKLVKLALATAIAASATTAMADDSRFYAGFGVSATGGELKDSWDSGFDTYGKTTTVALVDVGYAFSLNKDWGVAVGATYDLNKTDFLDADDIKIEGKNHYSVYAQPFFKLNATTSVFGKVSYNSIKVESGGGNYGDYMDLSTTHHGVGYGFGLRTEITQNVYLQAEAIWVDYQSKSGSVWDEDFEPKTTSGVLSVGYQF